MSMTSRLKSGALAAVAFCLATPVWAHDGHEHWRHDRHWHRHPVHERVVVREYVRPVPVYSQVVYPSYPAPSPAPAPGIHVVIPDIFFPFR